MKLTFEIVLAENLQSGDIFYCTPDFELNEFGEDFSITGTDQIFIHDDFYDIDEEDNYGVLVNGGRHIWFKPEEKVIKLGHYRDLVRILEVIKESNEDLNLGPNDIITLTDTILEDNPDLFTDLTSGLNLLGDQPESDEDEDNDWPPKDV